jgi:hypothetical protein
MGKKKSKSSVPSLLTGESSSEPYLRVQHGGAVVLSSAPTPHVPATVPPVGGPSKREKRTSQPDTAGSAWGNMRAPKLTQELKRELLIVKMRGALDPKRFYRSSDTGKKLPKYFQIGTVVAGAEDGRNRLTKRERKTSMLGELGADEAVRKRARSQFLKVQAATSDGVKRCTKAARKKGPANKAAAKANKRR